MSSDASIADPMRPAALTIDMVDRQLQAGFFLLNFQPRIESYFEFETGRDRRRSLVRTGLLGILIFDLYLTIDWQVLPDVFVSALIYRVALFTPLAGLGCYAVNRCRSIALREGLSAGLGLLAVCLPLLLFIQSASPIRDNYHYGTLLVMTYAAVVQRTRFRSMVAHTIGSLAAVSAALVETNTIEDTLRPVCISFYVTAAILLLSAAYALERARRRNYLLDVRTRLIKDQLEISAKLDPLTGLWNRRCLNQAMQAAWADSPSSGRSISVILIDIDNFKLYNDIAGHVSGDTCLKRFSLCLNDMMQGRPAQAARFGGEEFVIFAPGLDLADAQILAAELRDAVHRDAIPHPAFRTGTIVTASFGVASAMAPAVSPAALLAAADMALYRAKADGRDCIRVAASNRSGVDSRVLA